MISGGIEIMGIPNIGLNLSLYIFVKIWLILYRIEQLN